MAGLRDLLMRFRPVSTPGPAATGVPADRTAELAAELTPSLARLDSTAAEAEAVRAAARREADRIRRDAARRAEVITARASARSERVTEHPLGGVIGAAGGRSADLSLDAVALRVLDDASAGIESLWQP
ncbi:MULTISPECIES: hypothetical protein [unclassified Streptomyces]|uniref:hypothetical protein n=1 Tax=unclassified Streptomyces TaxID=2593676 RepID=UPI000C273921|nr:hypothetical protein [Streptomyces sp. CB02959]PJN32357.1 hypothetical protein CG747_43080 [Streptomyces sp. CB02959]